MGFKTTKNAESHSFDKLRTAMRIDRITVNPGIVMGKACIRDLRFPVSRLLGLMASGETNESILAAYPYLEKGDIEAALRYAVCLAEGEIVELARS